MEVVEAILVTMGDPAGIGPEVAVKALSKIDHPVTVVGSLRALKRASKLCGIDLEFVPVKTPQCVERGIPVIDLGGGDVPLGKATPEGGLYSYRYVVRASELMLAGKADALVTGPANKMAVNMAGIAFTGHTGLLAELAGGVKTKMLLYLDELRVSHVTTHIPLRDVASSLSVEEIVTTAELTASFLKRLGEDVRLGIAALNPHAGEGGVMGNEEIRIIGPAVEELRRRGFHVTGPLPSDTIFLRALRGEFNAVISMYHDQGHIPVKLLGFNRAVNVTLGLPYIRTSVDHGTAYDIAGKCIADEGSMLNAISLAVKLAGL